MLRKVRLGVLALMTAATIGVVGPPAMADAGSYCGHASGSHWHGITYNSYTYYSGRHFYSGSTMVHTHLIGNAYVAPMQSWTDEETNYCTPHY